MKKIFRNTFAILLMMGIFVSCSDDDWGDGESAYEHVYMLDFEQKVSSNNSTINKLEKDKSQDINLQFYSERVRGYDVTTYHHVYSNNRKHGVDFDVLDTNNSVATPNADGTYSFVWKQAQKGIQTLRIKRLSATKEVYNESLVDVTGLSAANKKKAIDKEKKRVDDLNTIFVRLFSTSEDPFHNDSVVNTVNNKTNDYEVRIFTSNYFQRVILSDSIHYYK